jgi:hypothetical protein
MYYVLIWKYLHQIPAMEMISSEIADAVDKQERLKPFRKRSGWCSNFPTGKIRQGNAFARRKSAKLSNIRSLLKVRSLLTK